ncbi:hypothetical protein TCAL_03739 [Tigriopus californicus]|uniref:Toxoplasma gondii family D protein n=1 Tax=Tigriopus californicus TaxID=6832 RepID=A0A553NPN6_TIGCA|nr:uncharacterized protein LOC131879294 [Tigriopus californicus]TRY67396.1 hypothetical protein TCAL_03739 [Tigriopus californicus]|eukprot:TCALIF_03739-PA protein Name:"Protein of unknown function" AED:0.01 eAED:0.01 QI:11/1/0.75/1/1/1/4/0/261
MQFFAWFTFSILASFSFVSGEKNKRHYDHGYFRPSYRGHKSVPLPVGCQTEFAAYKSSVCIPTVSRNCQQESVPISRIKMEQKCTELKVPECQVSKKEKVVEICGRTFEQIEEKDLIKSYKVDYAHRCEYLNHTICPYETKYPYRHAYGYQHTNHHCKEELRQQCFQVPFARPLEVEMTFVYPKEKEECSSETIEFATVECDEQTEEFCTQIPVLEQDEQIVQTCQVTLDEEKTCKYVEFTLPKTICRSRPNPFEIYGHEQ